METMRNLTNIRTNIFWRNNLFYNKHFLIVLNYVSSKQCQSVLWDFILLFQMLDCILNCILKTVTFPFFVYAFRLVLEFAEHILYCCTLRECKLKSVHFLVLLCLTAKLSFFAVCAVLLNHWKRYGTHDNLSFFRNPNFPRNIGMY